MRVRIFFSSAAVSRKKAFGIGCQLGSRPNAQLDNFILKLRKQPLYKKKIMNSSSSFQDRTDISGTTGYGTTLEFQNVAMEARIRKQTDFTLRAPQLWGYSYSRRA